MNERETGVMLVTKTTREVYATDKRQTDRQTDRVLVHCVSEVFGRVTRRYLK